MNIEHEISMIHYQLSAIGDSEHGIIQKRYLKSPFKFYGVSRSDMQKIAKSIKKTHPTLTQKELFDLCGKLWDAEYHECKSIALDLMNQYKKHIDGNALKLIDKMIDSATGWDHVDEISIRLVGQLLTTDHKHFEYIRKCEQSENFWKRRVSIICQLKLFKTEYFDQNLFFKICADHLYEKEFFIRKAIGWGLRELSKTRPEIVFEFISHNRQNMSGLTFREGSRRLPEELKSKLNEQ
jgi:3-methyladenine DNA glycosylase AlkD